VDVASDGGWKASVKVFSNLHSLGPKFEFMCWILKVVGVVRGISHLAFLLVILSHFEEC
jgi:hypothetical protein